MSKISLISWNVNGIRAATKKGFLDFVKRGKYDIVCVQETKVSADTPLPPELIEPDGYHSYWDYSTEKRGYSGVATYAKATPKQIKTDFGRSSILSKEGRLVETDFGNFILFNVYFPNGKSGPVRLNYKLDFYNEFLKYIKKLRRAGKKIIFCGDVNTAHQEIDLSRPKENAKISGFLSEERAWLDKFIAAGFVDTFRMFHLGGGHYSWWDQKTRARERNIGWRIDYFFASDNLKSKVADAFILPKVYGSDHCPIGLTLKL